MDIESLRSQIERLGPWHHDVEVAPGLTTAGIRNATHPDQRFDQHYSPDQACSRVLNSVFPEGLRGRSVLDCACNSGGYSIAAARHGGGRGFAFDARQFWVDQAEFLARQCGAPDLTVRCCELRDLPGLSLDPFDVTFFNGIFYHLPDPVAGLKIAADLTKELLIVNTAVLPRREPGLVLNLESPTHVLSGVDHVAWLPTGPVVMQQLLTWCGFKHTRIDAYWSYEPKGWKRLQMFAARDEATFAAYDRARPDAVAPPTITRRAFGRLYRLLRRA